MPAPLRLTVACSAYEHTRAIIDRSVRPEGIDLVVTTDEDHLVRQRKISNGEYDVCEFFTGTYLADLPYKELRYTALPIFPLCLFRYSNIYINRQGRITDPAQLNGARVGLRFWNITAGIWLKGILEEDFGIDISSITWVMTLPVENRNWRAPAWLKYEMVPDGRTEHDLLVSREVDAAITAEWWQSDKHPDLDHLFPDYEARDRNFYQRTGCCIPIMHLLAVRTRILGMHPWVARSLFDAFEEARRRSRKDGLAWNAPVRPGTPPELNYGLAKNKPAVDRLLHYSYRQGITPRKFDAADLFWPSLLDT